MALCFAPNAGQKGTSEKVAYKGIVLHSFTLVNDGHCAVQLGGFMEKHLHMAGGQVSIPAMNNCHPAYTMVSDVPGAAVTLHA